MEAGYIESWIRWAGLGISIWFLLSVIMVWSVVLGRMFFIGSSMWRYDFWDICGEMGEALEDVFVIIKFCIAMGTMFFFIGMLTAIVCIPVSWWLHYIKAL